MPKEPKFVILIGPPASGKGTQATRLCHLLNVPHIASGDLFREHLKNKTELGLKAGVYMERGELVPDEITIGMVMERLSRPDCATGALLDGFPRTLAQAEALDRTPGCPGAQYCSRAVHHSTGPGTDRKGERASHMSHLWGILPHQVSPTSKARSVR